jgi:hypothetical protein
MSTSRKALVNYRDFGREGPMQAAAGRQGGPGVPGTPDPRSARCLSASQCIESSENLRCSPALSFRMANFKEHRIEARASRILELDNYYALHWFDQAVRKRSQRMSCVTARPLHRWGRHFGQRAA